MYFRKTDPTLYEPQEANPLYALGATGLNAFIGMDAAGAAAFAHHLANQRPDHEPAGLRLLRRTRDAVSQYRRYRKAARVLAAAPEIPFTRIDDLLMEASNHRWIEAEKAGKDIWADADPVDPEGAALRDWFAKHYYHWRTAKFAKTAAA